MEECRHALFHAEEEITVKETEMKSFQEKFRELTIKFEEQDHQSRHHIEVVTSLEQELEHERSHRQNGEKELHELQIALQNIEITLTNERQHTQQREQDLESLHQTIEKLEITMTEERRSHQENTQGISHLQQVPKSVKEPLF